MTEDILTFTTCLTRYPPSHLRPKVAGDGRLTGMRL